MGSLWGPWVPLVTILGSLWDLVGIPWVSNGGFGGTLVRLVLPFFIPLTPFGLPLGSLGSLWDHLGLPLGLLGHLGSQMAALARRHRSEEAPQTLYIDKLPINRPSGRYVNSIIRL